MNDGKVVSLFISEEELQAAWERYNAAALRVHDLYRNEEPDEKVRFDACMESMAAERDLRAAFARARPVRNAG